MRRGVFGLAIVTILAVAGLALPVDRPLNNLGDFNRVRAEEAPAIIINEVAWAGSSVSSSDEWMELRNLTSEPINIGGYELTKKMSGEESLMITIPAQCRGETACIIPGEGYFLIAKYEVDDSSLAVEPDLLGGSKFNLVNSNLQIKLYNGAWNGAGELIDVTDDGAGAPLAGSSSSPKSSMERNDVYGPGDAISSWHTATTTFNLDPDLDVSDKGTPKSANSQPAPATPVVTLINPAIAEIDTVLEIESIEGENFSTESNPKIELRDGGQTITATDVHVLTPTLIDSAQFNLSGAQAGKWDVVVINPDGQEGILPNALELIEPEDNEDELDYSNHIIINEIYPKPSTSSNDEFIELYNTGEMAINLKGWQLDDQSPGGSAPYTIVDNQIISPKGYLSFTKAVTHISLNDSGDSARLLQPNGTMISQTTYDPALSGQSYAWLNQRWQWTLRVTKNAKNILELADEEDEDGETVVGDQLSTEENPSGIELELSVGQADASAVTLEWQLDELGYIDEVEIFVSLKVGDRGELSRVAPARQREAEVTGLTPNTKYWFTITGDYNAYTATSNQVTATTKPGVPAQRLNNGGVAGQLIITELLPNPGGGDSEWIEIFNPTDQPVIITGWQLMDKSKRRYIFNAMDLVTIQADEDADDTELLIEPGEYLLFDQDITGIHLNNSGGEEIYLLDNEDNIIDTAAYNSTAKRDYAYVLAPNEKWFWTTEATPGAANDITFAGEMEDGGNYLTPSGVPPLWPLIGWLSLLLSAIMLVRAKPNVKAKYQK